MLHMTVVHMTTTVSGKKREKNHILRAKADARQELRYHHKTKEIKHKQERKYGRNHSKAASQFLCELGIDLF